MTPKRKRLWLLVGSLAVLGVGGGAGADGAERQSRLLLFAEPGRREAHRPERRFRLGGLVEQGSVKKDGQEVRFTVTDTHKTVPVVYRGLLPDLFREGQGVIAEGSLGADGVFVAREVLAKHDENYMPPEVAKALKEAGNGRNANDAKHHLRWRAAALRSEATKAREPAVWSLAGGAAPVLSFLNRAGSRRFASLQRLPPAGAFASLQAPHDSGTRPFRAHPGAGRRAGAGDAAARRRGARRCPA